MKYGIKLGDIFYDKRSDLKSFLKNAFDYADTLYLGILMHALMSKCYQDLNYSIKGQFDIMIKEFLSKLNKKNWENYSEKSRVWKEYAFYNYLYNFAQNQRFMAMFYIK